MGQLEAISLLKRISGGQPSKPSAARLRRDRSEKRPLPQLSSEYLDTMFARNERVRAKRVVASS